MKSMTRFEKAKLAAIILAIVFYVIAKIGGVVPSNSINAAILPVVLNIYATIREISWGYEWYIGYLALQIVCLGLAWISVLIAYITNALCKWEYKLGNS